MCRRLQEKGYVIFCEYYPSVFGNPNIATPQLVTAELRAANNMDPTSTIFDPRTGKPFESEAQFSEMQKTNPGMGVFVLRLECRSSSRAVSFDDCGWSPALHQILREN